MVHDQLGKFSLQVTMVLWTLAVQDEADEKKTPLLEWKILPILREVLTLQSSLRAKASVGAAMLCLRKQGQPSPGFV